LEADLPAGVGLPPGNHGRDVTADGLGDSGQGDV
jgi:hypothetical protein